MREGLIPVTYLEILLLCVEFDHCHISQWLYFKLAWNLKMLLLGRKAMTNLDSILKSRDITLPTKVLLVKAMVFPVVMCGCESWTINKAECRRTDAFELWCWRILLRVPWTARRSNESILKEISPECLLERLMLKLKLQYFGHLMRRADSFEKTLMLGKNWRQEEKGTTEDEMIGWHYWLDGHVFEQLWELVMDREAWRAVPMGRKEQKAFTKSVG